MVNLVLHNRTRVRTYGEEFFRRICDAAAPYLNVPKGHSIEVGISIISSDSIKKMNREYRKKDVSTDVLSFPLHTQPIPGYTSILLGDLFISPRDVAAKAEITGRSVQVQMQWTVIHGLLHLAGHDHELGEKQAEEMFALEQRILKKL